MRQADRKAEYVNDEFNGQLGPSTPSASAGNNPREYIQADTFPCTHTQLTQSRGSSTHRGEERERIVGTS
jgi:hypothetical protein